MTDPADYVREDLLAVTDELGSYFLYSEDEGVLTAFELDEEGDVVSQYRVRITLEEV